MRVIRSLGWIVGFVACGIANASTATVTVTGTTMGQNIFFLADGTVVQDYAGGIVINVNGVSSSALCVDLFTNIAINDNFQVNLLQAQYLNASNTDRGLKAAYLYATQFGTRTSVVTATNSTITLNQAMAALQLAIWDIVHDGGDGLSAGRVRSSSVANQSTNTAVRNAALQYIQFSLNYQSGPANAATIYQHVNGPQTKQQLMGVYQVGTGPGIPEPTTSLLMGCGLGALAWRKYRSRGTQ